MKAPRRAWLVTAALVAAATSARAASADIAWERAFSRAGGPARLSFRAHYLDARGKSHELAVWRDGDRVRRDTDARLSVYVAHGGDDDRLRVFDRARNVEYRVRRANLVRLGSFPEWDGFTSLLGRSRGPVRALDRAPTRTGAGLCRWFASDGRRVCWSSAYRLPLLIEEPREGHLTAVLTVDTVALGPPPAGTLSPPSDGFMVLDVDRDLRPDID